MVFAIALAHFCMVVVVAVKSIAAKHAILCLRADIKPILRAEATELGFGRDGEVEPRLPNLALRTVTLHFNDGKIEITALRVVVSPG